MSIQTTCLLILLIAFIGIQVVSSAFIPVKSCIPSCPNVLDCCLSRGFIAGGYCLNGKAYCT